ncbi:MAG TPA: class I SAM-dependent methyltransferase [Candidatus Gracilibacteria bacterium]
MTTLDTFTLDDERALIREYPDFSVGLKLLFEEFNSLPSDERQAAYATLMRYVREGRDNTYASDVSDLVAFIEARALFEDGESITDLGAGPGDLVCALKEAYPQSDVSGFELSPAFIKAFNAQRKGMDEAFLEMGIIDDGFQVPQTARRQNVLSILTLDRLKNPKQLVRNMARFTGSKVLGTLLPVVGRDDNPSLQDNPTIYTPVANQITPGVDADEDKALLQAFLAETWGQEVSFGSVPYKVTSSGDTQIYDLGVFYTQ